MMVEGPQRVAHHPLAEQTVQAGPTTLVAAEARLPLPTRLGRAPTRVPQVCAGAEAAASMTRATATIVAAAASCVRAIRLPWPSVSSVAVWSLSLSGQNPMSIAVDGTSVYWTDYDLSGAVRKVPIDGGPPTTLASGLGFPSGIAVDAKGVYWTDYDLSGDVRVLPVGGLRDPLIGIKEFQTLEQKPVARKLGGQMRPLGAQATPPASLEWLHTNSCLG